MKKKILSVLLTLAMILSMAASFAGTVTAAVADADLTIHDYAGLEAFISSLATDDYAGKTVALGADITVNDGWVAVADEVNAPTVTLEHPAEVNAFAGTFDGDNHTISGLYMTGGALIPKVNAATIQNVTFDNCYSVANTTYTIAAIVVGHHDAGSTLKFSNVVVKNSTVMNGTANMNVGTMIAKTTLGGSTVTLTNCKSIDCELYSGGKTSLVGGLVGHTDSNVVFVDCFNSSDIYAMPANESTKNGGYKAGGLLGQNKGVSSFTNCINEGNVTAFTIAGGMVGDVQTKKVTVTNCINRGEITSAAALKGTTNYDSFAGGMIGRNNNVSDCSVINCINFGAVRATNESTSKVCVAGGMVGYGSTKNDGSVTPTTIEGCLNQGTVSSDRYAGGAFGWVKNELDISNFVNTGDISAKQKAGGLVGWYEGKVGTIEKVIIVGTISGYNNGTAVNAGSSCAAFGKWEQKNGTNEMNLIDFFYSNSAVEGGVDNVFGMWVNLGTEYNNHKITYTATGKSLDFVPGTTNTDSSLSSYEETYGKNLDAYNKFFVENGYAADPTEFYAENGANTFQAFNLGVDWMLTDTVPVPSGVFAMLEEKELTEGEIDYVGYQASIGSLSSIRVIAGLNGIDYANTGFELYLIKAGEQATMADLNTTTVYTAINVYDENGNAQDPFLASEAGYQYLSAITVTCTADQMGDATTLIVKPYVTVNGEKTYGDACAIVIEKNNGALVIADQYVM